MSQKLVLMLMNPNLDGAAFRVKPLIWDLSVIRQGLSGLSF
jgi:hypothetical protein